MMRRDPKDFLKVGSYTPETDEREAVIGRAYYRQGFIFKDEDAFLHHPAQVCYVPEGSDSAYTRQDFLDMCNGQEAFAAECFYAVDWQHPETWVEEQYRFDEWGWCEDCQKIYDMEGTPCPCPECGAAPESERRENKSGPLPSPALSSEAHDAVAASVALDGSRGNGQRVRNEGLR